MAIPFNVDRFKAELTNGGARPNQFAVQLTFPNYVVARAAAVNKSPFLVTASELPGQSIGVTPVYYRGRLIKMAGDREFAPFNCTVLNDSSFTIRTALEQWMNGIENLRNKTGALQPSVYQTDMFISQLDRNGAIVKTYKFIDAYPTLIGPIAVDYETNNQIETFEAEFTYNYWTSNTTSGASAFGVNVAVNTPVGTFPLPV
jgi:hypothetical protein